MDPSQLLNTSTPFDENKLDLFEKVVNTFYTTKNQNEVGLNLLFFRELLQTNY